MSKRRKPNWINTIAYERMSILLKQAEEEFLDHPERSDRYVELTRNISTKYNIKLPEYWRGRFCKNCNKFLKPGINLRVRLSNESVISKCLECGEVMKVPYTQEKNKKG